MTNRPQRKTYRLWQDLEDKVTTLASANGVTSAKMLNILVMEALAARGQNPATEQPEDEPEEPTPHPLDDHNAF